MMNGTASSELQPRQENGRDGGRELGEEQQQQVSLSVVLPATASSTAAATSGSSSTLSRLDAPRLLNALVALFGGTANHKWEMTIKLHTPATLNKASVSTTTTTTTSSSSSRFMYFINQVKQPSHSPHTASLFHSITTTTTTSSPTTSISSYSVLESHDRDFELLATASRLKNEWNLRQTARVEGFVFTNVQLDDHLPSLPQDLQLHPANTLLTLKIGTVLVGSEIKGLLIQLLGSAIVNHNIGQQLVNTNTTTPAALSSEMDLDATSPSGSPSLATPNQSWINLISDQLATLLSNHILPRVSASSYSSSSTTATTAAATSNLKLHERLAKLIPSSQDYAQARLPLHSFSDRHAAMQIIYALRSHSIL